MSKFTAFDAYAITAICLFSIGHWIGGSVSAILALVELWCMATINVLATKE